MTQTPAERRAAKLEAWRRWCARNWDRKREAVARSRDRKRAAARALATMTKKQQKKADRLAAERASKERAEGWRPVKATRWQGKHAKFGRE